MDGLKDSWTDRLRMMWRSTIRRARFTDDTGQALVLLDSIASTDYEPDTRDIALRMLAWLRRRMPLKTIFWSHLQGGPGKFQG